MINTFHFLDQVTMLAQRILLVVPERGADDDDDEGEVLFFIDGDSED